jgi:16S rRNA (uracil1498-N3)-methyltransferase
VERDDRAPVGTFFVEEAIDAGRTIALSERATHHARVKRMAAGDVVRLVDGAGVAGIGTMHTFAKGVGQVAIETVTRSPRPMAIHLRVPIGDRDRMLWLAEKATELGVESWQGVLFHRSRSVTPRGDGAAFAEKVRARMISALEQSGGAWLPRIIADTTPDQIDLPADASRILLDVTGEPMLSLAPFGAATITFGPEGGVEPREREMLIAAGWSPARLADTTLRFETAGIAATAIVRAAQLRENHQET